MGFDYWLGNIANSLQTLTFVLSAGLVVRAGYFDLLAYRRRNYLQEIVISLNEIRIIEGKPTLCIRDIADRELTKAVGQSRTAANSLLRSVRRLDARNTLVHFESRQAAEWIMTSVRHMLSKVCGPLFIAQAVRGQTYERIFISAVTAEPTSENPLHGRKVRVQLILEDDLKRICGDDGRCLVLSHEEDSPSYKRRCNTLHEIAIAWAKDSQSRSFEAALGRVRLTGLV